MFDLLEKAKERSWGTVSSLAGVLVWPPTRQRALAMIERFSLDDQVDVMHELYHVHDHMVPWASDYDLQSSGQGSDGRRFLAAWRVFRGLAWRIWVGKRPLSEMLTTLHEDSARNGLAPQWEAAFLEYTARNVLGLTLVMRDQGLEPVRQLRQSAERLGLPSLAGLLRTLRFIESEGELSARTLADGWRQR